jgi:hypothetical protein
MLKPKVVKTASIYVPTKRRITLDPAKVEKSCVHHQAGTLYMTRNNGQL